MSCNFKMLDGFHTILNSPVCQNDTWLDLADMDYLQDLLPDYDDWTLLAIYDGTAMEVIKVKNYCGNIIVERGMEKTYKLNFPCGAYVQFIMTKLGVEAMACCTELFADCNKEV